MKSAIPIIFYLFLFGCLALLYFTTKSGHDQSIESIKKERNDLKVMVDSMASAYNKMVTTKDHEAYLLFKKTQESANRFEARAIKAEQDLKHERNKRRAFSDLQTDSILNTVR